MRCPNCGQENSNLATRCAHCGTALAQDPNATISQQGVKPGGTAPRAQLSASAMQPTIHSEGGLREVTRAARRFARRAKLRLGTFFSRHQRLVGVLAFFAVIAVLGAVWLATDLLDAPAYSKVESEVAALFPTYDYAGGTYGPDLQISLSNTTATRRSATKTPEGLEVSAGIGPAAYGVDVELTYDDGKMRVVRDVAVTYARVNKEWKMVGEPADRGTSFFAQAGVDGNKVLANMPAVLDAANGEGDTAISDLYAGGSFQVVSNDFKEAPDRGTATDNVTIRCSQSNGFYEFAGNLVAHFGFESGTWKLRSCDADRKATTRTYAPLVGTWTGAFVSTDANGAKCYGAKEHQLAITIASAGDASGSMNVTGTITCMAHYHEKLLVESNDTHGDTALEQVEFTGTIDPTFDKETQSDLNVRCTTGGSPEGIADFVLSFGTATDPSAATCRITSTHNYEEKILLFIPHQTTATFTDTYALSRA